MYKRQRLGFALFAHGVDHGLRAEAPAELDLCEALARREAIPFGRSRISLCLLYTSDAADERSSVDLGGRRIIKQKNKKKKRKKIKKKNRQDGDNY